MKGEEYISDIQVVRRASSAVRLAIEKQKALNIPSVVYDRESGTICQLHADGTKTFVSKRTIRGRYSERIANK